MIPTPKLEYTFSIYAKIDPGMTVGKTHKGEFFIYPIIGGTVSGPKFNGKILPGGADWNYLYPNKLDRPKARYTLQADDGALIDIKNTGYAYYAKDLQSAMKSDRAIKHILDEGYFFTRPIFQTGETKYQWMVRSLFFAKAHESKENENEIIIQCWQVF